MDGYVAKSDCSTLYIHDLNMHKHGKLLFKSKKDCPIVEIIFMLKTLYTTVFSIQFAMYTFLFLNYSYMKNLNRSILQRSPMAINIKPSTLFIHCFLYGFGNEEKISQ